MTRECPSACDSCAAKGGSPVHGALATVTLEPRVALLLDMYASPPQAVLPNKCEPSPQADVSRRKRQRMNRRARQAEEQCEHLN